MSTKPKSKRRPQKDERTITPEMGLRIFKLMERCAAFEKDGSMTIYAGSRTFGGAPLKGLLSELHLLLRGHKPTARSICKKVK